MFRFQLSDKQLVMTSGSLHKQKIILPASEYHQSCIYVTCSRSWSFVKCSGPFACGGICCCLASKTADFFSLLLVNRFFHLPWKSTLKSILFVFEQISKLIIVYANWSFAAVEWDDLSHNIIIYIPVDFMKSVIRYALSGKAWDLVFEQRVWKDNHSVKYLRNLLTVIWRTVHLADFVHKKKGFQEGRM